MHLILWLEQSLSEVVLVADVLNWVVLECRHIFLGDEHDWDYSVIQDILDEWLQLFHCVRLLRRSRNEFECLIECFCADKMGLFLQDQLQVRLKQRDRELEAEIIREAFCEHFILYK